MQNQYKSREGVFFLCCEPIKFHRFNRGTRNTAMHLLASHKGRTFNISTNQDNNRREIKKAESDHSRHRTMTRPTMASSIWKMCFAVDEESEVPRHHICSSLAGEIAAASAPPRPELASPARRIRSAQARARQPAPLPSAG